MNLLFIFLCVGAMGLGAAMLFFAVTRMLALLRTSEVARFAVAPETRVTFDAPGTYVLHIEQPRLGLALFGATFALRDALSGQVVRSSPVIFRTSVAGVSTARVSIRYFEIPRAGAYRLAVTGLDAAGDYSRVTLIFTRPFGAALFLLILATVLGGIVLIAGLVFSALLYTGTLAIGG